MNIEFTVNPSPDFKLGEHIHSLPKEEHHVVDTLAGLKEHGFVSCAMAHGDGALQ